jgi:hypothetical protein
MKRVRGALHQKKSVVLCGAITRCSNNMAIVLLALLLSTLTGVILPSKEKEDCTEGAVMLEFLLMGIK